MTTEVTPSVEDITPFIQIADDFAAMFNINNPGKRERLEWALIIAYIHQLRLQAKSYR